MKKTTLWTLPLLLAALCAQAQTTPKSDKDKDAKTDSTKTKSPKYDSDVFYVASVSGFAYTISVNDQPFIYQEFMPNVPGYVPISTKEKAMKIVKVLLDKMTKGDFLPAITDTDIKEQKLMD